jgi:hypothetical protein
MMHLSRCRLWPAANHRGPTAAISEWRDASPCRQNLDPPDVEIHFERPAVTHKQVNDWYPRQRKRGVTESGPGTQARDL